MGRVASGLVLVVVALLGSDRALAKSSEVGHPGVDPDRVARIPRVQVVTETSTVPGEKPGGLTFVPIAGPIYSPEFQLMITGGAILAFRTKPSERDLNKSTLMAAAGYSTNQSVFFGSIFNSYWAQDSIRFVVYGTLKDMPDRYWGVGYDAGRFGQVNRYKRFWWEVKGEAFFRAYGPLYLGVNILATETRAREVPPEMSEDPTYAETGRQNYLFGLGPSFSLDTRDVPDAAYTGYYFKIAATFFGASRSDLDFDALEFDYRQYVPIVKPSYTLCWNVWSRLTFGKVPWHDLPQLGMQSAFRGYFAGQYRDKLAYTAVVEYRHMFHGGRYASQDANPKGKNAWEWLANRLGFAAFAGMGGVGTNFTDWFKQGEQVTVLPIVGGGLRFLISGRLHIRADVGVGIESGGFYLGVNEAF